MQRSFFTFKNVALLSLLGLSLIYAAPNFFPEQPILHVTSANQHQTLALAEKQALKERIHNALEAQQLSPPIQIESNGLKLVFSNIDTQLKAKDVLQKILGVHYQLALNLNPTTPRWLDHLAAQPMKLGLDLRGGIHFTIAIDIAHLKNGSLQKWWYSAMHSLRQAHIPYHSAYIERDQIRFNFPDAQHTQSAFKHLKAQFADLDIQQTAQHESHTVIMKFSQQSLSNLQRNAIQHTITILHNRVNELGIAEPIIQQQGDQHISVELPGVQDMARAQQILGGTATIAFHLVNTHTHGQRYTYQGHPIILDYTPVITGEVISDAAIGANEIGKPAVNITLNPAAERHMHEVTRAHMGHLMAILHTETQVIGNTQDTTIPKLKKTERIISIARINSPLGRHFQITGFAQPEAADLALLLRAGSLPAPIYIIEQTTIGPQLGHDNIRLGLTTILISFIAVTIFMALYYRGFGYIANVTLFINFCLLVGALSILRMTLTLSGMAGILLTIALAVDAQILIFERIREELRRGTSPKASITAGYNRAWTTILDANVATLIIAYMLFLIGTGAIKGFAVTLAIGIFTSMLSAVGFGRALIHYCYGQRQSTLSRSIGI